MSDDQITYFVCPSGHMNEQLRRIEHDDGSGEWWCNECDHQFGVWIDGGELDLGLVAVTAYQPGEQPPISFIDERFTEVVDGSGWTQGPRTDAEWKNSRLITTDRDGEVIDFAEDA